YGHTHLSELAIKDDLVFINPGSVTLPRDEATISTYILYNTFKKRFQLKELFTGDVLQELYLVD
uniref:metallophosphoesterase family protein n=1 Tax=Candidatus Magnetaquicoccus inordinatus TaxID=2496818 RepID=UPI00187D19E8